MDMQWMYRNPGKGKGDRMNQLLKSGVACLLFCALMPVSLYAADAPTTQDKAADQADAEPNVMPMYTGSRQDFDQICNDAGVEGEQLAKIHGLADKRSEKLKAWVASEDGKKYIELRKQMAGTRRARSAQLKESKSATTPVDYEAKIKEIDQVMRPLGTQYAELRNSTRGEILKELSPEQAQKAVTTNLGRRMGRMFESVTLTDEQKSKLDQFVAASASEYLKAQPIDQDPMLRKLLGAQNKVAKQVRDDVLTDQQREAMKKKEPATQKAPATQKQ